MKIRYFDHAATTAVKEEVLIYINADKGYEEDINGFFLSEVKRTSENIMYRLQDLAIKR